MVCFAFPCRWHKVALADSSQSQAKTKIVCSQNTKYGTAEHFAFLHMGPMSDVTMLGRLCVAYFGHAMVCFAFPCCCRHVMVCFAFSCCWHKMALADSSQSQAKTKIVCSQNTKYGTAEHFAFLHMGPMTDVTMLGRLCVADFGHAMVCFAFPCRWPKVALADSSQSQVKTKIVCCQNTKHGTAEPFHFLHMGPMSDVTMLGRLCVADFGHAMVFFAFPCCCRHVMICFAFSFRWHKVALADSSQSQAKTKIV
jgi:hypothetical protein